MRLALLTFSHVKLVSMKCMLGDDGRELFGGSILDQAMRPPGTGQAERVCMCVLLSVSPQRFVKEPDGVHSHHSEFWRLPAATSCYLLSPIKCHFLPPPLLTFSSSSPCLFFPVVHIPLCLHLRPLVCTNCMHTVQKRNALRDTFHSHIL